MGRQIIRQPDGRYAVFCSVTDTIVVWDATEEEVVELFAERAADRARQDVRRLLGYVAAGNPRKAYFQFALTWEEALAMDREHGGKASRTGAKRR